MLEFTNKIVGEIIIKEVVSEDDICNIIVNSFEGGSNYWMELDNSKEEWENKPNDEPLATWATKLLLEGKNITVFDIEDDDQQYSFNLKSIIKGIELNAKNRPWARDKNNWDAADCDCIIQYAIFKDVIYG